MAGYLTHAERAVEDRERKSGVFQATNESIVEGTMGEDYNKQASSTTMKNPNGHRSPHNPNTPYTNIAHPDPPSPTSHKWNDKPIEQPTAATLFERGQPVPK